MPIATINHIEIDERGIARIAGTRLKVHILMSIMAANHYNAQQLMEGYPHVPPAKMYAALAYYHDHKNEIDQLNERLDREFEEKAVKSQQENPELYRKLRGAKEGHKRGEDMDV